MRPTYAEIDLSAIRHNMKQIRSKVTLTTNIMAVVKADAYGHGALEITKAVIAAGATSLAVAISEEGIELRQGGVTLPIIILGLTTPEQFPALIRHKLTPAVSTLESINELSKAAQKFNIQASIMVAVDTGMGRIGVQPEELLEFVQKTMNFPHIEIYGVFTHLASADEKDKSYADKQLAVFNQAVQQLNKADIKLPNISAANSAAIIDMPTGHFNTVRPGIIMYGLPPSNEMHNQLDLRPAMSLKSKISYIKKVSSGTCIGYGSTYKTANDTFIATLPIGYADGYSRHLSNKASVLIGGQRHPVVGRVCMDQIMIDLGPICEAKAGDEVVLFGKQGDAEITVTELANLAGTINYELVCGISKRVPRIYKNYSEK